MKIITLTIGALCGLLMCSCNGRNRNVSDTAGPYAEDIVVTVPQDTNSSQNNLATRSGRNLTDSLKMEANAGSVVNDRYVGLLPAADGPGIEYDLLLFRQERNNNGVYELVMTYIEGDNNGGNLSFIDTGRYDTIRREHDGSTDSYIRLTPFNGDNEIFFIIENNGNLTLVNADLQRADSQLNYTIQKKN